MLSGSWRRPLTEGQWPGAFQRPDLADHFAAVLPGRHLATEGYRGEGAVAAGGGVAEAVGGVDRCSEVQALVLALLDEHHQLERVAVIEALFLALCLGLGAVSPVVELQ